LDSPAIHFEICAALQLSIQAGIAHLRDFSALHIQNVAFLPVTKLIGRSLLGALPKSFFHVLTWNKKR
jgi:hypothetical protein